MELARLSSYLPHSWARLLWINNMPSTTSWSAFLPAVLPPLQFTSHIPKSVFLKHWCHHILLCSRPVFPFPSRLSALARPQGPIITWPHAQLYSGFPAGTAQHMHSHLQASTSPVCLSWDTFCLFKCYLCLCSSSNSSWPRQPPGNLALNVSASKVEHTYTFSPVIVFSPPQKLA